MSNVGPDTQNWTLHKMDEGSRFTYSIVNNGPIAYCDDEGHGRLMASAPDLLRALRIALDVAGDDFPGVARIARAAISKAEGRHVS